MQCSVGDDSVVQFNVVQSSLKATVENPRGSVEKLSPKESVEDADTVLRGSVRAHKGFSEGLPHCYRLKLVV